MNIRIIILAVAPALLFCATPAMSHHSNSAYQVDQVSSVTGIVKEWKWTNPHTWLYLTVEEKGEKVGLRERQTSASAGTGGRLISTIS